MGKSRIKRGKAKVEAPIAVDKTVGMPRTQETGKFWPIPDLSRVDMAFGNVQHLPPYSTIPERFMRRSDPYAQFISGWFFGGRTAEDMQRLIARPGVDRGKALVAIKSALASFEPKHEHKEAGCAFLLHEWFELI